MRGTVCLLVMGLTALGNPPGAQDLSLRAWDVADAATTRLPPSAFAELGRDLQTELERRGCSVPQTDWGERHNVVRGRFTTATQIDVAVLCSVNRVSTILVFRGGSTDSVAELAARRDRDYLQGMGPGGIAYSRVLGVADPRSIREHHDACGGPVPPPLEHDGIDDAFAGKASVVWYWYDDGWRRLTGAD